MPAKGLVNWGMSLSFCLKVYIKMGKGHREVSSRWLFVFIISYILSDWLFCS